LLFAVRGTDQRPLAGAGHKVQETVIDLSYFTHDVDGRLYGGWYRPVGDFAVEIYARGRVRRALLGRMSAEQRACEILEQLVRGFTAATANSAN
jgi:hypothetical protein